MSEHKFKIGELVNYLSRGGSLGVYQITQLLPSEGEEFQYRIKNANEPHERMAKEHELCSAASADLPLRVADVLRLQRSR
jgi:hypothetical protein